MMLGPQKSKCAACFDFESGSWRGLQQPKSLLSFQCVTMILGRSLDRLIVRLRGSTLVLQIAGFEKLQCAAVKVWSVRDYGSPNGLAKS
jgi:hypothetical protein